MIYYLLHPHEKLKQWRVCFSAEKVANMFQNGTVDEIIDKFDEQFLDDIASKIGIKSAGNTLIYRCSS